MINKLVKLFLCGLLVSLASCINEETGTCSAYVRFVYDYNMAFEDLFHKQASKIDLYLFDEKEVFIRKLSDHCTPEEGTFPANYRLMLPGDLPYPLHIVAWVGIDPETCRVTGMTEGKTTREELIIQLSGKENNRFESSLHGLWHGALTLQSGLVEEFVTVKLTKNTNKLRIVLQPLDDHLSINAEDFSISLESRNGSYDHTNCVADSEHWNYLPCFKMNDIYSGIIAEIHTLRLFADRENRLQLTHEPQGGVKKEVLLDIDLNNYINAFRLQEYRNMPIQEYMDREESYKILIFITSQKEPGGEERYIASGIQINDWYIREQES